MITAVAGVSTTTALYEDTEQSIADVTAGYIDLQLGQSNGEDNDTFVNGGTATIFDENDLKPGDQYETTQAIRVTSNPSYICSALQVERNAERSLLEPERDAGDDSQGQFAGELDEYLKYSVWADDGDNVFEPEDGERYLVQNESVPDNETIEENPLVDSNYNVFGVNGEPLESGTTRYLGTKLYFADGEDVNTAMSDRYTARLNVTAVQERNNEDFICPGGPINGGNQRNILSGTVGTNISAEDDNVESVSGIGPESQAAIEPTDSNVGTGVQIEFYSSNSLDAGTRIAEVTLNADETEYVDIPSSVEGQTVEGVKLVGATGSNFDVNFDLDGDGNREFFFPVS